MDDPAVIRSAVLAERLGMGLTALREWYESDASLAGCILRRTRRSTWWSVQRLRDRGFLTRPDAASPDAPQAQAEAV